MITTRPYAPWITRLVLQSTNRLVIYGINDAQKSNVMLIQTVFCETFSILSQAI